MREWLSSAGGTAVLTIITSMLSGGILYQLIKVIPERRKIKAETVTEGVTATATLTQAAMAMVTAANEQATARVTDALERVRAAEERMRAAEARASEEDAAHRVCEEENLAYAREIGRLVRRLAQWEDWATEGKDAPLKRLDGDGHDGTH